MATHDDRRVFRPVEPSDYLKIQSGKLKAYAAYTSYPGEAE